MSRFRRSHFLLLEIYILYLFWGLLLVSAVKHGCIELYLLSSMNVERRFFWGSVSASMPSTGNSKYRIDNDEVTD